ncbi:MAG: catalase, partial [Nocardioidaceae bacterium]|nr:catalase [Nocardioidaceae bacterium]
NFAETEQVAFHTGHLVPGIDVTDDPLMAARMFSYLDTQITRLGGPNFDQIPVNRPHAPVNDMLRDGYHQHAVQSGVAPYRPNSLDAGCPFLAGAEDGAFVEVPAAVAAATKVRENPATFDDHYSQARLFWTSMTPVEKEHIVAAYTFELGKVYEQNVKERQLLALANIDASLCQEVATGLGLEAPEPTEKLSTEAPSPALSQVGGTWPPDGRMVGILVDPDGDLSGLEVLRRSIHDASMVPLVISSRGGLLPDGTPVQRTLLTTRSVELDALLVGSLPVAPDAYGARDAKAGGDDTEAGLDPRVRLLVEETFRHAKAIGAWGAGVDALAGLGFDADDVGVATGDDPADVLTEVIELLGSHRVWERFPAAL